MAHVNCKSLNTCQTLSHRRANKNVHEQVELHCCWLWGTGTWSLYFILNKAHRKTMRFDITRDFEIFKRFAAICYSNIAQNCRRNTKIVKIAF